MRVIMAILLVVLFAGFTTGQVHPDYFMQKAAKAYQQEDYASAINNLRRAISLDSSQLQAYHMVSTCYLQLGNWEQSAQYTQLGLIKYPQSVNLNWLLAEASLQMKDYEKAAAQFQRVADYEHKKGELPQGINKKVLHKWLGECYSQLGSNVINSDMKKALFYFKKANNYLSNESFSYVNLAFAHANMKQWDAVLKVATQGLSKFPSHEGLIKVKANALYHKKDYEGVTKEYKRLYENNPNDLNTAIAYAELLITNQKHQEASDLYNKLLNKYPKEKQIYESLMSINEAKLNYEGKVNVLRKMLPHFEHAVVYKRLAETYEQIDDWSTARIYYDTLLMQHSVDKFDVKKKIAYSYLQQDSLEKALSKYKELHTSRPRDAETLTRLAETQVKRERWSQALLSYEKLKAVETSDFVHTKLGKVHHQLGHDSLALHFYKLAPSEPEALLGVARLIRKNLPDESLTTAEEAFRLSFKNLEHDEDKLNSTSGGNSIAGLLNNKELLKEIEQEEKLATEAFHHLASYKYKKVHIQIDKLKEDFPKSARIFFLVGEFYYNHKQKVKALDLLNRSATLNPNFKETHMLLGALYEADEKLHQSILSYERALTLDNDEPQIYGHLIRLYRVYGQLDFLCDKWLIRYRSTTKSQAIVIKPHLIEALHKAGRMEVAQEIIKEKI